ncbi:bifunctional glycosyltransferase/CDP-glycerol:glycerophosphate glycerophosphotransferase [Actinomadura logoneensis]|uniref:bifunctional glycosyltransferase/CDP-glycerol:glycerophosphate glycerophosphotransferase n=1 Tax=Actinomadura logoneensis TaxID=2293572 RepID=UPI0011C18D13|nr:bifunctional glycosyltransferase/CDP-glycerol:glycerophosphate glycerophosphotransferase [Actinomadura logoneensis]
MSVVVPFYNVEAYLEPCLESLARQTLSDLEVIMVDDGSTDSSATIAKNFAERDGRFRLVQQHNQGLGPARNAGVPHSSGKYLAFADSDDIIPRYAYELMVASLEETGSDLACGGVRRFGVNGLTQSPMHRKIFQIDRKATHVREFPELLNDRTAWNKVFRRAFWDRHAFAFPAGLYEDIPVTIPAHVLANKVDVLHEPVYHWRIRESGARSITQRRTEPGNLADRMRSVTSASDFLSRKAPDLKERYDAFALADDIRIFVNVVDQGDEQYRDTFLDLVNAVLDKMDPAVYEKLPAIDRLKFHAVRQRLMPELVEIVSFAKSHPDRGSAIQRPGHPGKWYGEYPFLGDPRFPDHLYELRDELELKTGVDEIVWRDGRLRIEGHAYINRLHAPDVSDSKIEIEMRRRRLLVMSKTLHPKVERVRRPDVTAESKQATADLSWSGFAFEVTPEQLGSGEGTWHIYVTVTTHGVSRHGRLSGPKGAGLWPPLHETSPGRLIKPKYSQAGELLIGVQSVRAKVTSIAVEGEKVHLTGWVRREDAACVTNGHVEIALRQGMVKVKQPVRKTGTGEGGRVEFAAELDIAQLAAQTEAGDAAETGDSIDWDVSVRTKGTKVRLAVEADLVDLRVNVAGREYDVISTKYGNLTLVERAPRLVVTGTRWLDGSTIELTGSSADELARPDRLVMRMRRSTLTHEVPLTWEGQRFTALLDGRTGGLPLASGRWDLYAPGERGDLTVGIDRAARRELPEPRFVGMHELALKGHRGDLLHLFVRRALSDDERGPYAQRRMQRALYGPENTAPIRDLVVFESYFGKQYSDNPQAIYEEMVRRDLPFEYAWGSNDGQFTVPVGDARTVLRGSRDYHELVASSRFIIDNCLKPSGFAKRPGQVYVQTWHGTPYKHIAYDLVRNGRIASNTTKLSRYEEDVPLWDLLISPSPHVTDMLRRAFRYEGEVLEVGYPRNDMLFAPDREERARRVRDRLGIPHDRPVALYVPTWREDIWLTGGRTAELVLPADQVAAALGDSWSLLVRQHHMVADRTVGIGTGVVDVTRYPDISELYLIADAVITDYSSVMFDYAATGRPLLFYVPDLDFYQDELRGTYFDLTAEAPGPLLREPDEVVAALRDIDATTRHYAPSYAAFREKYCAMDDGHASARVVDHLLSLG